LKSSPAFVSAAAGDVALTAVEASVSPIASVCMTFLYMGAEYNPCIYSSYIEEN